MEQSIWIIIAIIIAVLVFLVVVMIINMAKEGGIKSLQDLFNLEKFIQIFKK